AGVERAVESDERVRVAAPEDRAVEAVEGNLDVGPGGCAPRDKRGEDESNACQRAANGSRGHATCIGWRLERGKLAWPGARGNRREPYSLGSRRSTAFSGPSVST